VSLSRRGSRIGISPRGAVGGTAGTTGSAPVDSAGMSEAAQQLLFFASTGASESAANKDASDDASDDDDEEEEEGDEQDEDDGRAVARYFQQQQRQERRAILRGSTTEMEARRQHLVENLVGMGFPFDWALRGADHGGAGLSEASAIAWIIEQMESDHAKMEEMDEGEDSRMVEDMEDMDEDHLEDESSASALAIAVQHRGNFGFHGAGGGGGHGKRTRYDMTGDWM
jgi:hypothetical protein